MSNLLDTDDRDISWLPPASSLGGEVDVACSGMASEASKREVRPVCRGRTVNLGLGTVGGQPRLCEFIGFAAVRAHNICFGLSVHVSSRPLRERPRRERSG